jgi:hypothetical protein
MRESPATDWLAVLRQQAAAARQTAREVPKLMADDGFGPAQASRLFQALEDQSRFVEKLARVLEEGDYDPDVVRAAERLEELYGDLAASVAKKLEAFREAP